MGYRKPRSWTGQQLEDAVRRSTTIAEALRRLGLRPRGENYKTFHRHVQRLQLSTTHFIGKAHLRGQGRGNVAIPLHEILVRQSTFRNTKRLTIRLLRDGLLREECYECGLTQWRGQKLPSQLDHINGDSQDHRLENLRILCPNCHALTPTYCGKNTTGAHWTTRARHGSE
jgi:5-methylcytosine-specific restriction endonuclease McrA